MDHKSIIYSAETKEGINNGKPIVALESTVLTHGLPHPQNLQLAHDMQQAVRNEGATPATIGFLDGSLHVGLSDAELERLANEENVYKVGPRDFATVIAKKASGGTTVAGTMLASQHANLKIFATGGIGGVHRDAPFDISAEFETLASLSMIMVFCGGKAVPCFPATPLNILNHKVPAACFCPAWMPSV